MILRLMFVMLILLPILFDGLLSTYFHYIHGMLYENGTCTNESITNSANRIINTSGTVDDFLKSLPSDNTILAEMVC
jgi:hypothetical protein